MKFAYLKNSISEKNWQIIVWQATALLSLITAAIAVFGWQSKDVVVRLVPLQLSEEVYIGRDNASDEYIKSHALSVALLMGNVTPNNAKAIVDFIEPLVDISLVNDLRQVLAAQIESIRREGTSLSFQAEEITYDKDQNIVSISGMQIRTNREGTKNSRKRTYEYMIKIRAGRPWITYIDAYYGKPGAREEEKKEEGQTEDNAPHA